MRMLVESEDARGAGVIQYVSICVYVCEYAYMYMYVGWERGCSWRRYVCICVYVCVYIYVCVLWLGVRMLVGPG